MELILILLLGVLVIPAVLGEIGHQSGSQGVNVTFVQHRVLFVVQILEDGAAIHGKGRDIKGNREAVTVRDIDKVPIDPGLKLLAAVLGGRGGRFFCKGDRVFTGQENDGVSHADAIQVDNQLVVEELHLMLFYKGIGTSVG